MFHSDSMLSTATSRRRILRGLGLLALFPALPAGAGGPAVRLASAAMTADGRHRLALIDMSRNRRLLVALPGRAHGILALPGNRLLAVARRPGRFAAIVDSETGEIEQTLVPAAGRHFYGHAVLSPDGRRLYTTENDFDGVRGVIGVRAAAEDWRQVAELPSHGIGPHELALAGDDGTLIVANGGIATHPDSGRRKLNLDSMAPNLARISPDGRLLEQGALPARLARLSLRHIDVRADGLVAAAGQFQGEATADTPLLTVWRPGSAPTIMPEDPATTLRMRGYCASVKFDASGRYLAVSAPRGGLVGFWSVAPARFLGHLPLADGAGVAGIGHGRFLLSSGGGTLVTAQLRDDGEPEARGRTRLPWHWDNHLTDL